MVEKQIRSRTNAQRLPEETLVVFAAKNSEIKMPATDQSTIERIDSLKKKIQVLGEYFGVNLRRIHIGRLWRSLQSETDINCLDLSVNESCTVASAFP